MKMFALSQTLSVVCIMLLFSITSVAEARKYTYPFNGVCEESFFDDFWTADCYKCLKCEITDSCDTKCVECRAGYTTDGKNCITLAEKQAKEDKRRNTLIACLIVGICIMAAVGAYYFFVYRKRRQNSRQNRQQQPPQPVIQQPSTMVVHQPPTVVVRQPPTVVVRQPMTVQQHPVVYNQQPILYHQQQTIHTATPPYATGVTQQSPISTATPPYATGVTQQLPRATAVLPPSAPSAATHDVKHM